jgi:hypothetical protein
LTASLNALQNTIIKDAPSAMQVVLGLGLLLRECARVIDYEEDHAGSDTPDYLQISQANLIFFVAVERAVCPVKQQVIGLIELAHKAQLDDENEEDQEDQQREDEEEDEDDHGGRHMQQAEKGEEDEHEEQDGDKGEQGISMRDEEGEKDIGSGNQEHEEEMQDNQQGVQGVVQKGQKRLCAAPPSKSKKARTEPESVRRSNRERHPSKKAQM